MTTATALSRLQPRYPDQLRADEFPNEFEGFVRARRDGKGSELPAFVLLYLPNDHTEGTSSGTPRPTAWWRSRILP